MCEGILVEGVIDANTLCVSSLTVTVPHEVLRPED